MKNIKIQIKQIKGEIDYTDLIRKACSECAQQIKENADGLFYETRNTHEYSKGWSYEMHGDYGEVFNKTEPQLSHLLEYGHLTRYKTGKYGKNRTWKPPQKHISPAFDNVKKTFLKDCENIKIKWEEK